MAVVGIEYSLVIESGGHERNIQRRDKEIERQTIQYSGSPRGGVVRSTKRRCGIVGLLCQLVDEYEET